MAYEFLRIFCCKLTTAISCIVSETKRDIFRIFSSICRVLNRRIFIKLGEIIENSKGTNALHLGVVPDVYQSEYTDGSISRIHLRIPENFCLD